MLDSINIVLINTSHPGNIGSAARAMKTMGLENLLLVQPLLFPHEKANEMASKADDVLEQAKIYNTLDDAIGDCTLVAGTSARSRSIPWPTLNPREFAELASRHKGKIAILFGREQSGLTNEELHRCHYHIEIPANPIYSSLNIASAVQIIAYELRLAMGQENAKKWDYEYASSKDMELFYSYLEKIMIDLEFLNPNAPRQLMTRLRRLFNRAHLDNMEINILRGILSAIDKKISD